VNKLGGRLGTGFYCDSIVNKGGISASWRPRQDLTRGTYNWPADSKGFRNSQSVNCGAKGAALLRAAKHFPCIGGVLLLLQTIHIEHSQVIKSIVWWRPGGTKPQTGPDLALGASQVDSQGPRAPL